MKALKINETLGFQRQPGKLSTMGVGKFRNRIDYNNLPQSGIWRVIAGTCEEDFDECIIQVEYNSVYMVKNWENTTSTSDESDEWAESWDNKDQFMVTHSNLLSFEEWLKENNAFNMIRMIIIDYAEKPGWENIELYDS